MQLIGTSHSSSMSTERAEAKPARKHAGNACQPCRKSKTKCDAKQPCEGCIRRGKEDQCIYLGRTHDLRRAKGLHPCLYALAEQVDYLTRTLRSHNITVPPPPHDESVSVEVFKVCKIYKIPTDNLLGDSPTEEYARIRAEADARAEDDAKEGKRRQPSNEMPSKEAIQQSNALQSPPQAMGVPNFNPSWDMSPELGSQTLDQPLGPWDIWSDANQWMQPGGPPQFMDPTYDIGDFGASEDMQLHPVATAPPPSTNMSLTTSAHNSDDDTDDREDAFIDQFADRYGALSISSDGQSRVLNAPSHNRYLDEKQLKPDIRQLDEQELNKQGRKHRLDFTAIDQTVPPAIEQHLVNLYFLHQESNLHLVDQKMYERVNNRSTFLINAMYAEYFISSAFLQG